jgi:flavin-dependent dehydrogenase
MLQSQPSSDWQTPRPVILGTGLTGLAISRALSAAEITHVLVGRGPSATPRLGESLNGEGSLEIVRQFPDESSFFFKKNQLALFFGGNALLFNTIPLAAGRAFYPLLGYPSTVQLLHVDRVGFDRALFDAAIKDPHCLYVDDAAAALDYRPAADRIDGVLLASGPTAAASYVFDATNHVCFVARKLGIARHQIGETRRVVFAHSRPTGEPRDLSSLPWLQATALLRLEKQRDQVDGLAWCIPLGVYVSVGVSVDPAYTGANPELLLDWVASAYATRGINVGGAFPARGAPVDVRYQHYTHERCYGRNWLLAGPSCAQVWFHSAAGVATGLIAARLAVDALRAPAPTGALYQSYLDEVVASHAKLDWIVRDGSSSLPVSVVRQRAQAMIVSNVKRLGGYLGLNQASAELAFGDGLLRMYEGDRLLANPLLVDTALPEAQAAQLFGGCRQRKP